MTRVRLIHGVYHTAPVIYQSFQQRCAEQRIDFSAFSWASLRHPPGFTNDPEVAVVLDATLGTFDQTFDFAWRWMASHHLNPSRQHRMRSKIHQLRPMTNGRNFTPWTMRWVRIKLNAYPGQSPQQVCDTGEIFPGCAMLLMGAQHPSRIKAIDGKKHLGFWMPGVACESKNHQGQLCSPCIYYHPGSGQVDLFPEVYDKSPAPSGLAVPSFFHKP